MKFFLDCEFLFIEGRKYYDSSIMSMFFALDNKERETIFTALDLLDLSDKSSISDIVQAADRLFDYFCDRVVLEFYKKRVSDRCKDLNIAQVRSIACFSSRDNGILRNYSITAINRLTKKQLISILEIERKYKYYLYNQ